jgi:small GTP-binding protein
VAKVIFVGDSAVGKTSIVLAALSQADPTDPATIALARRTIPRTVKGTSIALDIWDTSGIDEMQALVPLYARDSHVAVLTFDLSVRDSFDSLSAWLRLVRSTAPDCLLYMVGNKVDETRIIPKKTAQNLAADFDAQYFETSAAQRVGIDLLFGAIAEGASTQLPESTPAEEVREEKDEHCRLSHVCSI